MQAAYIEAMGHVSKCDNVASTLTDVAGVPSSKTTRKFLLKNAFFIECPSFDIIHNQLALRQIHSNSFSLFIDH